jgi:hypothetical protein
MRVDGNGNRRFPPTNWRQEASALGWEGETQVALAKVTGGNGPKPMQDSPMVVSDIGADLPICLDTTVQSRKSRQLRETYLDWVDVVRIGPCP